MDTPDTIFCIDEPESHMHARLQAELLSVLYDLIPENCQLLMATHSIGMMRRARDIEAKNPGSVVFLDFGDCDFDQPQTIEPVKNPNRAFWERAYKVALGDLAALVAPSQVVICEGEPLTGKHTDNQGFDADCYHRIFEGEFPETKFVSMGSDRQIIGDKQGLAEALRVLIDGLKVVRLIDRDDRTDEKISELRKEGVRVLSRRNLESYLFDDEVIQALATSVGKAGKTEELLVEKEHIHAVKIGSGAPRDNLKPGSHDIYVACKKILGLTQYGNDAREFACETLARLNRVVWGGAGPSLPAETFETGAISKLVGRGGPAFLAYVALGARRSVREAARQHHVKTTSAGDIKGVEDTTVRTWITWSAKHKWVSRVAWPATNGSLAPRTNRSCRT